MESVSEAGLAIVINTKEVGECGASTADVDELPLANGTMEKEEEDEEEEEKEENNTSSHQPDLIAKLTDLELSLEEDGNVNYSLTDEDKIELRRILENYFSAENLAIDKFLISQMDYDQFIPISIVSELELVQQLTVNLAAENKLAAIIKTLQEIPSLQLSDGNQKVRRIIQRSTLILREISAYTPIEEIRAIFSGEGCPPILGCEFAHNDNWYIQFGSEDDANRAYCYLRESGTTFQGRPILARIKSKAPLAGSCLPPNRVSQPMTETVTPMIPVQCYANGVSYTVPEQSAPFFQPQFATFPYYNPFQFGGFPGLITPWPYLYATPGDNQTTVELINARQRKPNPRFTGFHHGGRGGGAGAARSDHGAYNNGATSHEHKQPPRFNRKRNDRTERSDSVGHSNDFVVDEQRPSDDGCRSDNGAGKVATTTTTDHQQQPNDSQSSVVVVGDVSPAQSAESNRGGNYASRYGAPRRGNFRGRRGRWNMDGGGNSRRPHMDGSKVGGGGGGSVQFELETSSFPPLSSSAINLPPFSTQSQDQPSSASTTSKSTITTTATATATTNITTTTTATTTNLATSADQVPPPSETTHSLSNRVDQSTTTDANDLDNVATVFKGPQQTYAQIAKRLKQAQTTETAATSSSENTNAKPVTNANANSKQLESNSIGRQESGPKRTSPPSPPLPPPPTNEEEDSAKEWKFGKSRGRAARHSVFNSDANLNHSANNRQ